MTDNELLHAISESLAPMKDDIKNMKLTMSKLLAPTKKDIKENINLTLENELNRRIQLIAEGQPITNQSLKAESEKNCCFYK